MLDNGALVVDSVSHCFNHTPENHKHDNAQRWDDETFELGEKLLPDSHVPSEEVFYRDHQPEELARLLFLESQIDYTVYHSLPLDDYFHDGYVSREKGFEFREQNPNRVGMYVDINPLEDDAVEQVEHFVKERDVDGIKLYPARYQNGQDLSLQLNERSVQPILDKADELDVDTVAIHKFIPFAKAPTEYFRVNDVEEAANKYPDLNFEVIHVGFSFLEETIWAMASNDNVYANLENSVCMVNTRPRKFAKIMGELLYWVGSDRVLFASGATALHPQPPIEGLWNMEMPEELKAQYDYPDITEQDKRNILGENALELLGKDPDKVRQDIQNDRWAKAREELDQYPAEPWSTYEVPAPQT